MSPHPDTVMRTFRDYLDEAKRALREARGQYVPTKKESAELQLRNDILEHADTIRLTIDSYFGGCFIYMVRPNQGNPYYTIADRWDEDFEENPYVSDEFDKMLSNLHIEEWKHKYDNPHVLDGTQWNLNITFTNDRKRLLGMA